MNKIGGSSIDLENSEDYIPDRQNVEAALRLARAAVILSALVILVYMSVIQYLLLRIRFSKSKINCPTPSERLAGVIYLWICHRLFDVFFSAYMDTAARVLWNEETALNYRLLRYGPAFENWILTPPVDWTLKSNAHVIFWEVLVTWLIYMTIYLSVFITLILLDTRQNPRRALVRCRRRMYELASFMRTMALEEDPIIRFLSTFSYERSNDTETKKIGQTIQLSRHQEEVPIDGQRILNWDLGIDKEALGEMMETLGPPGGFGELGFNISAGKVCFGAMGVGTRFNLNFVLEPDMKEDKSTEPNVGIRKRPRGERAQSN